MGGRVRSKVVDQKHARRQWPREKDLEGCSGDQKNDETFFIS